jgi:Carboxypeptidase regulatory-like domain/TonB-dependent Receptor Plug Domain
MKLTALAALFVLGCVTGFAQSNSGTVRGSVLDPSGAAITGATAEIQNPVSHYDQTATTDANGNFSFSNLPFNNYHLSITAAGFQGAQQDVQVRSAVAVDTKFALKIGAATTSVTVEAAADLVENDPTAHTDVDRQLFDKLPLESAGSSLSSMVTLATPGVSADSNGLFHGLGDHASNSFSIDGMPITDQQSKAFSNQLPLDAVESTEVIEGAPPAEYGDKTSLVIVATTRSGLGVSQPHGDITASYGTFGSITGGASLSYGGQKWGNFIALDGLDTGRFLDGPEFQVFHDHGNKEDAFDRVDFKPSENDTISADLNFTRSWFQNPNSYDAQGATAWSGPLCSQFGYSSQCNGVGPNGQVVGPTDQRSQIRTFIVSPSWTHVLNTHWVSTFGVWVRQDQYNYYPSDNPFSDLQPDLQLQTIGQNRRLTNLGSRASLSYSKGIHNIKMGVSYADTLLTEKDSFGVIDPTLNPVCLNANGTANTNPSLTNPLNCGGAGMTVNPNFNPLLACYDLTRTGPLPASDGCPASTSGQYLFAGHADIREVALYLEDSINLKNWTFSLGIRGDIYDGITKATQAEPRLGAAYNIKQTGTVLRLSYARTMETPFNENLILSSEGCANPVVNAIVSSTVSPCVTTAPLTPGTRNEYHVGLQQAFGKFLVIDGEYIWKYTDRAFDFSVLGNSPITFPIEWDKSKIPGAAVRASMPNFHGLTAFVVLSHVAARFFEPQVSGIGAGPYCPPTTGCEVFRIDHDEAFNQTTHLQYSPWKKGRMKEMWFSFNYRFDSGQVAGAVPCAGGDCANGPNGSNSVVDVSNLTPDQQFQAGLFCGGVHATPTMGISANGLCAASMYGSTLLSIPAPGTENDDHNPPRVAPRSLFDAAVGHDNIFHGERYKWSARISCVNLTNNYALYNFLSTFSGTHYVTPRSVTATLAFHF